MPAIRGLTFQWLFFKMAAKKKLRKEKRVLVFDENSRRYLVFLSFFQRSTYSPSSTYVFKKNVVLRQTFKQQKDAINCALGRILHVSLQLKLTISLESLFPAHILQDCAL